MVTSFSVVSFSRIGVHCNRECCDRTALDGHFSLLLLGGAGERPAVTLLPGLFGGVDAFCFSILPLLLLELLSRSDSESDSNSDSNLDLYSHAVSDTVKLVSSKTKKVIYF